jgi:hypothetical protein
MNKLQHDATLGEPSLKALNCKTNAQIQLFHHKYENFQTKKNIIKPSLYCIQENLTISRVIKIICKNTAMSLAWCISNLQHKGLSD